MADFSEKKNLNEKRGPDGGCGGGVGWIWVISDEVTRLCGGDVVIVWRKRGPCGVAVHR